MTSIHLDRSNGSSRKPTAFGLNVFLACPITQLLDPQHHELPSDYEHFIRAIYQFLRLRADRVFLALDREGWGKAVMPPEVCTPLDFAEMQRCSLLVAYPGRSMGVSIELGWAAALGKPMILLLEPTAPPTPLIDGLSYLPGADVQRVTVGGSPCLATARGLEADLDHALSRFGTRRDNLAAAP